VEAMVACGQLPKLPINLPQLEVELALKEILKNKVKSDEIYRNCVFRHNELVRWINEG
jgi:hypothetical protein